MKYCPFCGADLIEGAVSFCAECGKELPPAKTEAKQSNNETILNDVLIKTTPLLFVSLYNAVTKKTIPLVETQRNSVETQYFNLMTGWFYR